MPLTVGTVELIEQGSFYTPMGAVRKQGLDYHAIVFGGYIGQDRSVFFIHQRVEQPMGGARRKGGSGTRPGRQSLLVEGCGSFS